MNELGNTPDDKNYRPSGISKAESMALEAYPNVYFNFTPLDLNAYRRAAFIDGFEHAEHDIIAIIESRISEIIGDAQPKPILRAELQELIERIKEGAK